jgi:hypothetical protein
LKTFLTALKITVIALLLETANVAVFYVGGALLYAFRPGDSTLSVAIGRLTGWAICGVLSLAIFIWLIIMIIKVSNQKPESATV